MDLVVNMAQWLLSQAGAELFSHVRRALLVSVGLAPDESQEKRRLLDEYTQLIDQRLASKVLFRLDEDRLAALKGGLAQLRSASRTELRREYLANAANTFFTLASIPDAGTTAGIDNRQIKAIANLGVAAVHVHFGETLDEVAENVALAVRLHRETAALWLGGALVDELFSLYPSDPTDGMVERATASRGDAAPRLAVVAEPGALHREHVKDALKNANGPVDFKGLVLSGADLTGLDLRVADFRKADLTGADLTGTRLGDPSFWGSQADLRSANLTGAVLEGAELSWCRAERAVLRKALADRATFNKACLNEADMSEASLVGAHLVKAQARGTLLVGANLENANLERADLTGARLVGARCRGAALKRGVLDRVDAQGIDLSGSVATQMQITKGSWRDADFSAGDMSGSTIREADLEGAVLRGANAQNCSFAGVDLRRVDLEGADLRGVKYDKRTLWPPDVVPVARGARLSEYL